MISWHLVDATEPSYLQLSLEGRDYGADSKRLQYEGLDLFASRGIENASHGFYYYF